MKNKASKVIIAILAILLLYVLMNFFREAFGQTTSRPVKYQSSSTWANLDTITEVFANIFLYRDSLDNLASRFPLVDEYESETLTSKTMVYQFADSNFMIILKYNIFVFKTDCILEFNHECFVFEKGNSKNYKSSGLRKTIFTCHLADGVTNASEFYMPFYSDAKKEKVELLEGKMFVKSDEFGGWNFIRATLEAERQVSGKKITAAK